jgi:hypothetical protein
MVDKNVSKIRIFCYPFNKCEISNCNKSLNFKNFSKIQNGLESKLYKLNFIGSVQVQ